jgi:hypothetical protein
VIDYRDVEFILYTLGLSVTPCGLSADWIGETYHLGPGGAPNEFGGDFYLTDNEDVSCRWALIQRHYPGGEPEDSLWLESTSILELAQEAKRRLASIAP